MSIKYAILGLLSWKPSTGYDLKKIFEDSSAMYWSGNNNQIYKSLVQLLDEGLVTNEIQHQESSPSKKIYTITKEGLDELRGWIISSPEPPEYKKTFLIQLAWADRLSPKELDKLLSEFENEIKMQLLLQEEKKRRGLTSPGRTARETYIWDMISENMISSYKSDLTWVRKIRSDLNEKDGSMKMSKMDYNVIEVNENKYVEIYSSNPPFGSEQDALDLIAVCGENDTNLLMLHWDTLSEDFYMLKTRIAGQMLQKFVNYDVKTAIVATDEIISKGRFRDLVLESNRGNHFRVFTSRSDAENWLIK